MPKTMWLMVVVVEGGEGREEFGEEERWRKGEGMEGQEEEEEKVMM